AEDVAAGHAGGSLDRVAKAAQAIDVATERPGRDLEPRCELGARPARAGLQEGEEAKKASRCLEHEEEARTRRGPELSSMGVRVPFTTTRTNADGRRRRSRLFAE